MKKLLSMCLFMGIFFHSLSAQYSRAEKLFRKEVFVESANDPAYNEQRQNYRYILKEIKKGKEAAIVGAFSLVVSSVISRKGRTEGVGLNINERAKYKTGGTLAAIIGLLTIAYGTTEWMEAIKMKNNVLRNYFSPGLGSIKKKEVKHVPYLKLTPDGFTLSFDF